MHAELLRLDVRLRRRMLLGTGLGAAAYLFVIIAVYPTFVHDSSLDALVTANPAAAAAFGISGSITSPAGWLGANMYANIGPLLALLLTIGYGAAAVAGQDADGLLGLVATQPLTRWRILANKVAALALVSTVVPLVSYAVCLTGPHYSLTPDWGALGEVTVATTLLAFDFGAVALLVGVVTRSRGLALGVASGLAAAAYLISSLASVNDTIHAIRGVSPFSWAVGDDQLVHGVTPLAFAALVAVGVGFVSASAAAFRRADIH